MPTRRSVPLLALMLASIACFACGTCPPAALAAGAPRLLADSTTLARWTLPNGLQVVTRDIPRAGAVSITVGYRFGMDDDPEARAGLAQIIGLIGFTAATANQPARQRADLDRMRPLGWSYPVLRHITLYSEIVAPNQLATALGQIAERMRGVQVTAADVQAAVPQIKREIAQQYFGDPTVSLAFQVREIGRGLSDETMVSRASGAGLAGIGAAEVQSEIRKIYVPSNAVLSLAGDLRGSDTHALALKLFGDIPAGTPRPQAVEVTLKPAERILRHKGEPAAVVGLLAPSLSDSTHPAFYLATVLFAGFADQQWNTKDQQRAPRLQFGLFDEPELARFTPDLRPNEHSFDGIQRRFNDLAEILRGATIPGDSYDEMRSSVTWLMGGAMTPPLKRAVPGNAAMLMTLSRAQASTGLRKGFEFWDRYRVRLENVRAGQPETQLPGIVNAARQVRVMTQPPAAR